MRPNLMLPGEYQLAELPPRRSPRMVRFLVMAWLLGGLAFLIWKLGVGTREPPPTNAVSHPPITAISSQDLVHHVNAVNERLANAGAKLRKAQEQLERTLPSVERNDLLVEKQHLENAITMTKAARLDLEQGREDTDLILNSLKKEQLP
jgi:hypothetical protein